MSDDPGSKSNGEDLKSKILSSINTTFTGEATSRWITAMKEDAFDAVEEAVPAGEGSKLNLSMAALIDRLFDNFKRYSFEFNRTQENREYEISCERPASMRTTAEYHEMGKPIKYCLGHLASRNWALIIQGEENRVLVYITPIEFLVGFKPGLSDFPPHLEMRQVKDPAKTSRDIVWAVNNQILSTESLPVLARRLFTQLIKVSKREAEHTEVFAMSPQEEKLALAQTVAAPVDRSFEDAKADLLGQKKPALAERTFVVAAPADPLAVDAAESQQPGAARVLKDSEETASAETASPEADSADAASPEPAAPEKSSQETPAPAVVSSHNSKPSAEASPSIASAVAASPFATNSSTANNPPAQTERPPLNALLSPQPMPSLAASSSYPQVAAAIANGEPKALNAPSAVPSSPPAAEPPNPAPTPVTAIPPIPASLPASAPAPTLVAEPSQLSNDEAIAALIFPEPPRPAGSPPLEPLPPQVPTAVPVAVSLPPFVTAAAAPAPTPKSDPGPAAATDSVSAPVHMPESEPKAKIGATATPPAAEFAADLAAAAATAQAVSPPTAKAEPLQLQAFQLPQELPRELSKDSQESTEAQEKSERKDESDKTQTAPQATLNSNLEITGQHSGGKINVADNNGKPSLEKESAEAKRNIAQSLKGLFDSVDGAISGLTAIGLEAMHSDDIETVGSVMKQTKALKSLRESVVTLSKDWQKTIE